MFYQVDAVPAHSVLQMPSREIAVHYPKGRIALGFCSRCGFIFNTAFDPGLNEYSTNYEETQGYSGTFNVFHRDLAAELIERHNLRSKTIIEIGCGKGDFLSLICSLGSNRGIGFDPAFVPERRRDQAGDVTFIQDFYSEKYAEYQGDLICCKMTLEHIPETATFVSMVRRSLGGFRDVTVFFQVPDTVRVLSESAFWDIYYEHCSYFSAASLSWLFRDCGFSVTRVATGYDGQYLMIEGQPISSEAPRSSVIAESAISELRSLVDAFSSQVRETRSRWHDTLREMHAAGKRVVLWGGGSKAVAFLTTIGIEKEIEYTVDINPFRQGMFMAGTGQEIVAPEFLRDYRPDAVVLMNPIYEQEVRANLCKLALKPELMMITAFSGPSRSCLPMPAGVLIAAHGEMSI
ncbi:MAG: C-methyltransferase [Bryobacterales bacterium]|nr:C-methyltransferase [Bryobacterales bacterium]